MKTVLPKRRGLPKGSINRNKRSKLARKRKQPHENVHEPQRVEGAQCKLNFEEASTPQTSEKVSLLSSRKGIGLFIILATLSVWMGCRIEATHPSWLTGNFPKVKSSIYLFFVTASTISTGGIIGRLGFSLVLPTSPHLINQLGQTESGEHVGVCHIYNYV